MRRIWPPHLRPPPGQLAPQQHGTEQALQAVPPRGPDAVHIEGASHGSVSPAVCTDVLEAGARHTARPMSMSWTRTAARTQQLCGSMSRRKKAVHGLTRPDRQDGVGPDAAPASTKRPTTESPSRSMPAQPGSGPNEHAAEASDPGGLRTQVGCSMFRRLRHCFPGGARLRMSLDVDAPGPCPIFRRTSLPVHNHVRRREAQMAIGHHGGSAPARFIGNSRPAPGRGGEHRGAVEHAPAANDGSGRRGKGAAGQQAIGFNSA